MKRQPRLHHGRTQFFIEGEGFVASAMPSPHLRQLAPAIAAASEPTPPADTSRAFRFCRLFPDLNKFQPDDAGLIALGQALDDPFTPGAGDSQIPAGFTYFGQFIDHDLTFDRTDGIPSGSLSVEEIEQGRSPALELDSLYGRGPNDNDSAELYEADHVHFRVGNTLGRPLFGVTAEFPNELPRRPVEGVEGARPKQAIIGDPRNDENLIVAQTHVAFLKFHNRVADHLQGAGIAANRLFEEARKTVVQHYQSIVLHDFVRRLVEPGVFSDVVSNGRKFFRPGGIANDAKLCMPVEFSGGVYRLGHSMVRGAYQWNRVFSSNGLAILPGLNLFFEFSEVSGDFMGDPRVPSDWIPDWRRMYDFSEQAGGVRHPQLNFARQIDTKLANGLQSLPEFANAQQPHLKSLAVRNLLRGRLLGLPTGQDVAAKLDVPSLTPSEVASGPQSATILSQGFDTETPLWFYILKEAEVKQSGQRLGPVGSRILVEVFHGLVEGSEHSILKEANWKPSLPAAHANHFTMNELLLFVNDLNPIGDAP